LKWCRKSALIADDKLLPGLIYSDFLGGAAGYVQRAPPSGEARQAWGEGMTLHRIVGIALTCRRNGGRYCRMSSARIRLSAARVAGMACGAATIARACGYDES